MEFKKVKVSNSRELAIKMNATQTGAKRVLFDRIMASGRVTKIDEDSFKYSCLIAESAVVGGTTKLPTWVDLTPQPIPQINGVDMATGATVGFFGPTSKENVAGAEHHNFLLEKKLSAQFLDQRGRRRELVMRQLPPLLFTMMATHLMLPRESLGIFGYQGQRITLTFS